MDKKEFIKSQNKVKKVWIDLDQVLADFDKRKEECRLKYPDMDRSKTDFWHGIEKVDHFYRDLELMPDANNLMKYLNTLNVPLTILTALPRHTSMPEAEQDKKDWVKEHFGDIEFRAVFPANQKQKFSGYGMVLIDDKEQNIREWINKGGIGIIYKDFQSCKTNLENYL